MRLMVWNINRFTDNSLNRNTPYNQWYILETVAQQAVDIFVVVEVQSTQGIKGSLIAGGGATGSLELLAILREESPAADWRLVPPLKLVNGVMGQTYTEGIAVFYSNTTLDFTGPYYWNNNQGIATAANAGTNYPAAWNGALPVGNNRAGKINFVDATFANALNFPNPQDRPPFQTNFTERALVAPRNIKLFSVHLPPNQANAAFAMTRMAAIGDIQNVGVNEVLLLAGDFNFNLRTANANHVNQARATTLSGSFNPQQFTMASGATTVESINNATIAGGPPGYGYLTNDYLDRIYVRYGTGLVAPAHNPLVINRVVGTPPYGIDLLDTIPAILAMGGLNAGQQLALFQEEENYGHIAHFGGVSDHLPLVMDF